MSPTRRRRRPLWVPLVGIVLAAVGLFAGVYASGLRPKLGLDLAGGAYVAYTPTGKASASQLELASQVISDRLEGLGVSSAQVQVQGNEIVVQMAGVKNPRQLVQQIGQTGQVEFRPVACTQPTTGQVNGQTVTEQVPVVLPPFNPKAKASASSITPSLLNTICQKSSSSSSSESITSQLDGIASEVPSTQPTLSGTPPQYVLYNVPTLTHGKPPFYRYLLGPLAANGTIISSASAGVQSGVPGWVVQFTLTKSGSSKWNSIASANYLKSVAIAVGGEVYSAPVIEAQNFNGSGVINGSASAPISEADANNIALVMKYGSLPITLKQLTLETVSPSLGKSSLRAGLLAGLLGMVLVMAYTIVYYRALGVVVVSGLAMTALLLWSITALLGKVAGETLDLAGVTGVIVSIGVTVDSYIVYFERLKDDVRQGKTIRSSVDKGFQRAYRTVLAADAVSFIGAVVLWLLAIGPVKGFAFFLGLSTLLDVFATYFFTRPLVILLGRNRAFTEARWIGVARGLAPEPLEASAA